MFSPLCLKKACAWSIFWGNPFGMVDPREEDADYFAKVGCLHAGQKGTYTYRHTYTQKML